MNHKTKCSAESQNPIFRAYCVARGYDPNEKATDEQRLAFASWFKDASQFFKREFRVEKLSEGPDFFTWAKGQLAKASNESPDQMSIFDSGLKGY